MTTTSSSDRKIGKYLQHIRKHWSQLIVIASTLQSFMTHAAP